MSTSIFPFLLPHPPIIQETNLSIGKWNSWMINPTLGLRTSKTHVTAVQKHTHMTQYKPHFILNKTKSSPEFLFFIKDNVLDI